jgi:hypothetical protein
MSDPDFSCTLDLLRSGLARRAKAGETSAGYRRRGMLWMLSALRHHARRDSVENRWCSFEPYSRWPSDHPSMPFALWYEMFRSTTCRHQYPQASPIVPPPPAAAAAAAAHDLGVEPVYVSIVVAARHDDLRGDYVGRLQSLIDVTLYQCQRYNVTAEVIVVDWYPVEWLFAGQTHTVKLKDLLRVDARRRTMVRVITVDSSVHTRMSAGTGVSFLEYAAKNVGARRARGRFVLFTNGDVLLSDAVMEMLGGEALDEASFYRVARSEVPGLMDPLAPLGMRVAAMEELVGVLTAERTCPAGTKECPGEYNRGVCEGGGLVGAGHAGLEDEPFLPAAGDFFLVSKAALHRMGGYHQVTPRPRNRPIDISFYLCARSLLTWEATTRCRARRTWTRSSCARRAAWPSAKSSSSSPALCCTRATQRPATNSQMSPT